MWALEVLARVHEILPTVDPARHRAAEGEQHNGTWLVTLNGRRRQCWRRSHFPYSFGLEGWR